MLGIRSEKLTSVEHCFFRRNGGVSSGLYVSLNCSRFVGDDEQLVFQNLDIARKHLGVSKLVTLQQAHGRQCIVADCKTESGSIADAIVTKEKDIAIGILTADCAPILFLDEINEVIGAAHAGWRGIMSGIIISTVQTMLNVGAVLDNIKVAVGPCILQKSYIVDEDFKEHLEERQNCFGFINSNMCFDLPKCCFYELLETGIEKNNIDLMMVDTYADPENYFSYRFAKNNSDGVCGRQISAISLKKWK
ncbi:MAG: peptidoglycan editing factor PgeF [Holosporaceae bacterium]|jgi:YfiH family protein|nr:peptidoglycan editing factor PgeF [Holosporaceae bacterium]